MDMKGSIAAIKDAITKSTAERTSPEVISAAYAVVNRPGVAALIGAAIGYIISCGLAGSIRYLAAIVLVYTISFAFQDTKLASKSVFAPATAAVSALSTGILSSFTSVFTQAPAAAVVLIETVFSFGGCWFFREAMSGRERTTESEELRYAGSVLITAAVLLMAVSQIEIFGAISLGRLVAVLIVMTCTLRCGIMTGCTIGTAFGIAMDLTAGRRPPSFAGLLSGMFNRHGRLLFLLSFIIANAAAVSCAWAFRQETGALFEVFAASVIFLLLPSGFLSRAGSMVQPVIGGSGESGLRRYVARKVMSLSDAYGSLYDIVRRNVEEQYNDADPAKVFDRAADSVCLKCKEKNRCWNRDYIDTLSALNDATPKMLERGTLEIGDIPRRFTEKCKTPEAFVTAVNAELRAAAYRRQFAETLRESRNTAWGQYSDMAEILGSVSKELAGTNGADHLAERRLIRYLLSLDIDADVAVSRDSVYRDARGRLRAVIESGALARLTKQDDYLERLSGVLGVRLCRLKSQNDSEAKLVLMEAEPLAVSVGIAALKKKGEKVSGDRGTYFKTDAGVLCVILSDGMGCGEAAASESRRVIEILESFLRAGVDPAVAMKTLNSVMLLKCGDNWGFATVDLMCVDLFSGETCFYKYGAAPSYVSASRGIRRIKCESFAPGLSGTAGAEPDIVRMRLKPGNTAIIASDGVVGDDDDAWLRDILTSCGDDMKQLARDALKAAEHSNTYSDDMTVLAVRVEERA